MGSPSRQRPECQVAAPTGETVRARPVGAAALARRCHERGSACVEPFLEGEACGETTAA